MLLTIGVLWLLGFDVNFWVVEFYVTLFLLLSTVGRWTYYIARYYRRTDRRPQVVTSATAIVVCGHEVDAAGNLTETFKCLVERAAYLMHNMEHATMYLWGGPHASHIASALWAKRFAVEVCNLSESRVKTPAEAPIRGRWAFNTYQEVVNGVKATGGDCIFVCQWHQMHRVRVMLTMLGYNCEIIRAPCPATRWRIAYEWALAAYTVLDPHNFGLNLVSKVLKQWLTPIFRKKQA